MSNDNNRKIDLPFRPLGGRAAFTSGVTSGSPQRQSAAQEVSASASPVASTNQQDTNRNRLLHQGHLPIVQAHEDTIGHHTPKQLIDLTNEKERKDFKSVDVYTVIFSVNQDGGVTKAWLTQEPDDGDPEMSVPMQMIPEDNDYPGRTLGEWGLEGLEKTPAKRNNGFEIDTVVMKNHESGRLSVAALIRVVDSEDDLERKRRELELDGVWQDYDSLNRAAVTHKFHPSGLPDSVVNLMASMALKREILRVFDKLKEGRSRSG